MSDCWCDNCAKCRKEMREMTEALRSPPQSVTLSERALKILAEPIGYTPPPRKPVPKVIVPKIVDPPAVPVPCVDCGELRGRRGPAEGGWGSRALSGRDGRCELCTDAPRFRLAVADPTTPSPKLTRARRGLERVLKDGRAYHPDAPHGTNTSYDAWGCRCTPCRSAKGKRVAKYRATQRASQRKVAA